MQQSVSRSWRRLALYSVLLAFALPQAAHAALTITSTSPLPAASLGTNYSYQFTASGAAGAVTWAIVSGGVPSLTFSSGGLLSGTPQTSGLFAFTVTATDAQQQTARGSFVIVIGAAPVSITTVGLPVGTLGTPYSAALQASGGSAGGQLTWSLSGGSLPQGLTLSNGGVISGTPLATGSFSISVTVQDAIRTSDTRGFTLRIDTPVPPDGGPQISGTCSAGLFPSDKPVSIEILPGTDAPLTYTVVSPSWMSIQRNGTRVFATGPAPAGGQYTLLVQATDSLARVSSFSCTFSVAKPLSVQATCPAQTFTQGSPITIPVLADGGSGTYLWTLTAPAGLKLTNNYGSSTSIIADASAAGDLPFTLVLNDGTSAKQTFTCTVHIAANPLNIAAPPCPAAPLLAGQVLSIPLTASGGVGAYTWSVQGPSWLSLSGSTGSSVSVSGTAPAAGGKFSFTLTLKDAQGGAGVSYTCQVDVLPALSIAGVVPPLLFNQSFTTSLTGSGGNGDYTWKIAGPSWFGLSTNGATAALSGIPPSTDPFACTVTLSDSAGSTPATFDCSAKIAYAALAITADGGACPSQAVLGKALSGTLTARGGNGAYQWTLTGPGFLSSTGNTTSTLTVSGSPDTAGPATYSVKLEDTAGNTPASYSCSLQVAPPNIPAIQIVGLSLTGDLTKPVSASLQLADPAPVRLDGAVQLSFSANTADKRDNPQVQFTTPPGGRTLPFSIPAGSTVVPLGAIQPGTVAGTIRLEITALTAGGASVLGSPRPFRELTIPRLAPVLADPLAFESESNTGFTIAITGYTTTREATNLQVTLTPRTGATLKTTSFTVPVTDSFSSFFNSDASASSGGTFTLRIPLTVTGNTNDIGAVSVKLTNTAGDSNVLTRSR